MIYTNGPVALLLVIFAMSDLISQGRCQVKPLARSLLLVVAVMLMLPVAFANSTRVFDSVSYMGTTAALGVIALLLFAKDFVSKKFDA